MASITNGYIPSMMPISFDGSAPAWIVPNANTGMTRVDFNGKGAVHISRGYKGVVVFPEYSIETLDVSRGATIPAWGVSGFFSVQKARPIPKLSDGRTPFIPRSRTQLMREPQRLFYERVRDDGLIKRAYWCQESELTKAAISDSKHGPPNMTGIQVTSDAKQEQLEMAGPPATLDPKHEPLSGMTVAPPTSDAKQEQLEMAGPPATLDPKQEPLSGMTVAPPTSDPKQEYPDMDGTPV